MRICGGKYLYDICRQNLTFKDIALLPEESTVRGWIRSSSSTICPPLRYINNDWLDQVSARFASYPQNPPLILTEDATAIQSELVYVSSFDCILGYNRTPIPAEQTTETTIDKINSIGRDVKLANNVYAYVLQPLLIYEDENNVNATKQKKKNYLSPPSVLLSYDFTCDDYSENEIQNHWDHLIKMCQRKGLNVVGQASDGNASALSGQVTRLLSHGFKQAEIIWFDILNSDSVEFYFQDPAHQMNKIKNAMSGVKCLLIGNEQATIYLPGLLAERFYKEKDHMRVDTTLELARDDMINLLCQTKKPAHVYLRVLAGIKNCFFSSSLSVYDRLRELWVSCLLLRGIRWNLKAKLADEDTKKNMLQLLNNHRKKLKKLAKKKCELNDFFISANAFASMEVLVNSTTRMLVWLAKEHPKNFVDMSYIGSQACECLFRALRSLSSVFSTVANFNAEGFIKRSQQIQQILDISNAERIKMPQKYVHSVSIGERECISNTESDELLSERIVEQLVESSRKKARYLLNKYVFKLGSNTTIPFVFEQQSDLRGAKREKTSNNLGLMEIDEVDLFQRHPEGPKPDENALRRHCSTITKGKTITRLSSDRTVRVKQNPNS